MATKAFDKMIKTELEAATKAYKLEKEVQAFADEAGHEKPTNADYVSVLEAYKAEQDKVNEEQAKAKSELPVEQNVSATVSTKISREEEIANMAADLHTMIPVVVTDHDDTVNVEDDSEARTVPITYGNPIIGMTTVYVPRHGKPMYLPKGAVIRLKRISLAHTGQDADGNVIATKDRKRFSVADTTGWTPEEFEAHREEQKLKKLS